jgi:hypothetical protein
MELEVAAVPQVADPTGVLEEVATTGDEAGTGVVACVVVPGSGVGLGSGCRLLAVVLAGCRATEEVPP